MQRGDHTGASRWQLPWRSREEMTRGHITEEDSLTDSLSLSLALPKTSFNAAQLNRSASTVERSPTRRRAVPHNQPRCAWTLNVKPCLRSARKAHSAFSVKRRRLARERAHRLVVELREHRPQCAPDVGLRVLLSPCHTHHTARQYDCL